MSVAFNPAGGLVVVNAEVVGPTGTAVVRLALDTGATATVVNSAILVAVGYDPAQSPTRLQVTTGSGIESVPVVAVTRLQALGQDRNGLSILAHTLPPSAGVDGVLGLDFLRGQRLVIDFRAGQIELS